MKAAKSKSEEFSLQEKNFNYGDMNYNYYIHFAVYTNTETLCYTHETNVSLGSQLKHG